MKSQQEHLIRLREILVERFNTEELRDLCFDLGVPYDRLGGEGHPGKVRELIALLVRSHGIGDLVTRGKQLRPDAAWPYVASDVDDAAILPPTTSPQSGQLRTLKARKNTAQVSKKLQDSNIADKRLIEPIKGNPGSQIVNMILNRLRQWQPVFKTRWQLILATVILLIGILVIFLRPRPPLSSALTGVPTATPTVLESPSPSAAPPQPSTSTPANLTVTTAPTAITAPAMGRSSIPKIPTTSVTTPTSTQITALTLTPTYMPPTALPTSPSSLSPPTPMPTDMPAPTAIPALTNTPTPTQVNDGYISISVGAYHVCGIKADHTVKCGRFDPLGKALPPSDSFNQISAGNQPSCGLKTDNSIVCWGDPTNWQTAQPSGSYLQVSAGWSHACGLRTDGSIACWGYRASYQQAPSEAGPFKKVGAGQAFTCGLDSNSAVHCWGEDKEAHVKFVVEHTPSDGTFTQISVGRFQACGLRGDGTADCWGESEYPDSTIHIVSAPPDHFTQISAGGDLACGLHDNGTILCWGDPTITAKTPSGTSDVFTQVSAGYRQACGLKSDSSVVCWWDDTIVANLGLP